MRERNFIVRQRTREPALGRRRLCALSAGVSEKLDENVIIIKHSGADGVPLHLPLASVRSINLDFKEKDVGPIGLITKYKT